MRTLSDFIASTKPEGEPKPAGPLVIVVFVAALIASATGVAYWIGGSISQANVAPIATAGDFNY
jgi:hypothetical protein